MMADTSGTAGDETVLDASQAMLISNKSESLAPSGPIFLWADGFILSGHLACCFVGFPLNLLIVVIVVVNKRLHLPRHVIWLGVALSNVLIMLNRLVKLYVYLVQDRKACKLSVVLAGLPYSFLLLNLFLALVDRYVSITFSEWYKRSVRVGHVVFAQLLGSSLLVSLTKLKLMMRWNDISCDADWLDSSFPTVVAMTTLAAVNTLCQVLVYFKVWKCVQAEKAMARRRSAGESSMQQQQHRTLSSSCDASSGCHAHHLRCWPLVVLPETGGRPTCPAASVEHQHDNISRVEMDAARNVTVGLLSLFLFSCPSMIFYVLSLTYCSKDGGSNTTLQGGDDDHCHWVLLGMAYSSILNTLHAVYNPTFYILRSRDLAQLIRHNLASMWQSL